jgi:hypothetical protein
VSVGMCTYQGEAYLQQQLESIGSQTLPPDELVICDDVSTDGTASIVDRFRPEAPFPIRFFVNQKRLGPTKNFERAILLCEGDVIFLADQDDVWHLEKLNSIMPVFLVSPEVGAVFHDADVVDGQLEPLGFSVWDAVGFTPSLQKRVAAGKAFEVLLKRNVVGGMTMAFRSNFRDLVLPLPDWFHDCWIPLLIAAVADVAMVPQRLVRYRQHGGQEIGVAKTTLAQKVTDRRQQASSIFLNEANQYEAAHRRLTERPFYSCSPQVLRKLEAKSSHIRARAMIRRGHDSVRLLMREIVSLNYQRYSSGLKSIAIDLFRS